ncbi:MAG: hypothetical protein SGPRY_007092 [Prymnesium sp.]
MANLPDVRNGASTLQAKHGANAAAPSSSKQNRSSPSKQANSPAVRGKQNPCEVCGDASLVDTMVVCSACGVTVHKECYCCGQLARGDKWLCVRCSLSLREDQAKCVLCGSGGGALLRTTGGSWCHGVCALYVPGVALLPNPDNGSLIVGDVPSGLEKLAILAASEQQRSSEVLSGEGAKIIADHTPCHDNAGTPIEKAVWLGCPKDPQCSRPPKHKGKCKFHAGECEELQWQRQAGEEPASESTEPTPEDVCSVCRKSAGVTVRCAATGCNERLHPYCALRGGLTLGSCAHFGADLYFMLCISHSKRQPGPSDLRSVPPGLSGLSCGFSLEGCNSGSAGVHTSKAHRFSGMQPDAGARRSSTTTKEAMWSTAEGNYCMAHETKAAKLARLTGVFRSLRKGVADSCHADDSVPSATESRRNLSDANAADLRSEACDPHRRKTAKRKSKDFKYPRVRLVMSRNGAMDKQLENDCAPCEIKRATRELGKVNSPQSDEEASEGKQQQQKREVGVVRKRVRSCNG